MPITDGNYENPGFINDEPPDIDEDEMNDLANTVVASQRLTGSGAPAASTVGALGQHYLDTSTTPVTEYVCTAVDSGTYSWVLFSATVASYWDLIQSYTTAGTYTFTAPDLFGDARAYIIGVFVIAGGGSGGAAKGISSSDNRWVMASGGASGHTKCFILTVTPGNAYAVVVGAGGIAVSVTADSTCSTGNTGGSSSFNGITATGGSGGLGVHDDDAGIVVAGADGGQGSDAFGGASYFSPIAPAMGNESYTCLFSAYLSAGGRTCSVEALNLFTLKKYLGAGGGASARSTSSSQTVFISQPVPTLDDGLVAGAAAARASTTDAIVTASTATSPGSGGGAAVSAVFGADSSKVVTSGAGADGAVFIYVKG